jgi:hypothetical protein
MVCSVESSSSFAAALSFIARCWLALGEESGPAWRTARGGAREGQAFRYDQRRQVSRRLADRRLEFCKCTNCLHSGSAEALLYVTLEYFLSWENAGWKIRSARYQRVAFIVAGEIQISRTAGACVN